VGAESGISGGGRCFAMAGESWNLTRAGTAR